MVKKKNNNIKIPSGLQLDIFEKVFFQLIDIPSYREHLKRMILVAEKADLAEVDYMLTLLAYEIMERKQKEQKGGNGSVIS